MNFVFLTLCGAIDANIAASCSEAPQYGIDDEVVILNWSDIDQSSITYDGSNDQIVTDFDLTGSPLPTGFTFTGMKLSGKPSQEGMPTKGIGTYNHKVMLELLGNTPEKQLQLKNMDGGRYVLITKNLFDNASDSPASTSVYQIYGLKYGLELKPVKTLEDASGWALEFSCFEGKYEPTPAHFLFVTDLSGTATFVNSLL